jgi:transcriptional repressor NrdR
VRCPSCNQDDDRVIESRSLDDGTAIRRRRACNACGSRFTTYERCDGEESLRVVKKDGRAEAFDRRKLLKGLAIACEKRPVPAEAIEAACNRVHQALLASGEREVPAQRIGALAMEELHRLDQVAYVRFASVYKEFKDLPELLAEMRRVLTSPVEAPP